MQWRRLAPVIVVAGGLILVACLQNTSNGGGPSSDGAAAATTLPPVPTAALTTAPPTAAPTAAPTTAAPTTPATTPKVPLVRNLRPGLRGDDVKRMQQRLVDLKFDPGIVDGVYGPATAQAVWAYQKLVMGATGKAVNGLITNELWDRMQDPLGIGPRRPNATPTHLEVYLPMQVAVLYEDGQLRLITHISTGSGKDWCAEDKDGEAWCGKSVTPGGVYKFYRRASGWWEGSYGRMHNPVYFNYGIAVHGMTNVPIYPASHGCVRLPMHISEYFPTLVRNGDQVFVWDGVKEPEKYGRQPPPFDVPDPSATTTTTVAPTTVPPPTTAATTGPRPTPPPTTATTRPTPPPTTATTAAPTTTATTAAPSTSSP
jgi:peptidoglycan hydrolase-like protein with peptidoglycan-binding domain